MLGDAKRWLFNRKNKEEHVFFNPALSQVRASGKWRQS